jgi:membrane-bound lytic murein transglycosylase D
MPERGARLGRERVERLLPVIAPILRREGVPVQLAAVVLVESGGNPMALSPKGARGLWQLMPGTAREYGLIVNGGTDQRLDVVLSTEAAAKYLRDLYAEFGNWKLALAAYNAGEQAVHRAMARTGGDGFATASIALPAETQSYVPAVFDALGWFGGPGPVAYAAGE